MKKFFLTLVLSTVVSTSLLAAGKGSQKEKVRELTKQESELLDFFSKLSPAEQQKTLAKFKRKSLRETEPREGEQTIYDLGPFG